MVSQMGYQDGVSTGSLFEGSWGTLGMVQKDTVRGSACGDGRGGTFRLAWFSRGLELVDDFSKGST